MAKNIYRISLESAATFSLATFVVILISSYIHDKLHGTTGAVSEDVFFIITLCVAFIFFVLAISTIVMSEQNPITINVWIRLLAVALFIFVSAILLGILGWIAWAPIY